MPNHEQLPEYIEKNGSTVEVHPAYGVVQVSRRSSSPGMNLFGSDLSHQHYIAVTVCRASVHRELHRDWTCPGEDLVEFSLSEAQWAKFVAGASQSFATEVTLERYSEGGKYVMAPEIARKTESRKDQFDKEFQQKLFRALEGFSKSVEALKELSDGKSVSKVKLKEVVRGLQIQLSNLPSNMNFAVEQFREVTERNVEEAKVEIEAYLTAAVQRSGLESLAAQAPTPIAPAAPSAPVLGSEGDVDPLL